MKNQKGFSLIELLVVVIIIAIIAAIAIPSLPSSRRAANESSAIGSMRTFHSAAMTFYATQNPRTFPADGAAMAAAGVELIDTVFADAVDGGAQKASYDWDYTLSATPDLYTLTAIDTGNVNGQRSLFVDQTGVLRTGAPGSAIDNTGDPLP